MIGQPTVLRRFRHSWTPVRHLSIRTTWMHSFRRKSQSPEHNDKATIFRIPAGCKCTVGLRGVDVEGVRTIGLVSLSLTQSETDPERSIPHPLSFSARCSL